MTAMAARHEIARFLIADDDVVDVLAIKRSIKQLEIANSVQVAKDGVEALEILRGDTGHDQNLPPYIVTLDLNMPRMNGHEFLAEVRKDPLLCRVIIFVWSTSEAPDDIHAAYSKNVAGYIVKQQGTDALRRALSMLDNYSRLVVFPV